MNWNLPYPARLGEPEPRAVYSYQVYSWEGTCNVIQLAALSDEYPHCQHAGTYQRFELMYNRD